MFNFKFNDTNAERKMQEQKREAKRSRKYVRGLYYKKDRIILQTEAKAINAELGWNNWKNKIEITVTAPHGFLWASTLESTLNFEVEKMNQEAMREAIQEIIASMAEGYKATEKAEHDEDCECDFCELATDDPDLEELDF